uniref:Uncharacterized protein n=1 Tax=Panagrolaimus davidi TaxID=227884 RepID=A0A914P4W1_9BILA
MYYLDDGIPKRYGRIFDMVEFIIINSDRWLYRVESEPDSDFIITDNCNTFLNSSFISSNNSIFDSSHDKIIRELPDPLIRRLNELYDYPFKINELP